MKNALKSFIRHAAKESSEAQIETLEDLAKTLPSLLSRYNGDNLFCAYALVVACTCPLLATATIDGLKHAMRDESLPIHAAIRHLKPTKH